MGDRASWDHYFLELAAQVATRATCPRMHAGAVVVAGRAIVATGYNGAPALRPHCTDAGCLMWEGHCIRSIHAETNALLSAGREAQGSTLYVTNLPCVECCKLIIQASVYTVVLPEGSSYQDNRLPLFGYDSLTDLLRRGGVQVKLMGAAPVATP